ncbi:MAG: thiamine phosphate synthase [Paramuribaculum sp.]|nr:thiamine phosphate synthase [Paramuribaculum sp.]
MTDRPLKIAITPELIEPDEPQLIRQALAGGFDYVHLRHPGASLRDMRNLIEAIPAHLHPRLKLHGHFDLLHSFNLGGVHLNKRCPAAPAGYRGKVSCSSHSIDELTGLEGIEYATLSPIFDSISKIGYTSRFTPDQLRRLDEITNVAVIALGGITPERVDLLADYNFSGYAVLGALRRFIDN